MVSKASGPPVDLLKVFGRKKQNAKSQKKKLFSNSLALEIWETKISINNSALFSHNGALNFVRIYRAHPVYEKRNW
jgi:hypothetical protein